MPTAAAEIYLRLRAASLLEPSTSDSHADRGSPAIEGRSGALLELDAIANAFVVLRLLDEDVVCRIFDDLALAAFLRAAAPPQLTSVDAAPPTVATLNKIRSAAHRAEVDDRLPLGVLNASCRLVLGNVALQVLWITRDIDATYVRFHSVDSDMADGPAAADPYASPLWCVLPPPGRPALVGPRPTPSTPNLRTALTEIAVHDDASHRYELAGSTALVPGSRGVALVKPRLPPDVRWLELSHPDSLSSLRVPCLDLREARVGQEPQPEETPARRYLDHLEASIVDGCYGPPLSDRARELPGVVREALVEVGVLAGREERRGSNEEANPASRGPATGNGEPTTERRSHRSAQSEQGRSRRGISLGRARGPSSGFGTSSDLAPWARPIGAHLRLDQVEMFIEGYLVTATRCEVILHAVGPLAQAMLLRDRSVGGCWPPWIGLVDATGASLTDGVFSHVSGALDRAITVSGRVADAEWPLRLVIDTPFESAWVELRHPSA